MNEDIYLLLDGDLSDTDSALLFRQLSESSEERLAFRQQLRLQSALSSNEHFNGLTTTEDADLLARLAPSIGLKPAASAVTTIPQTAGVVANPTSTAAISWFNRRAVVMLLLGFILGTGLGVTAGRTFFDNAQSEVIATTTPQSQLMPPAVPINRDSLVTALRDSIRTEMAQAEKQQPRKKVVRRNRKPMPDNLPTPGH